FEKESIKPVYSHLQTIIELEDAYKQWMQDEDLVEDVRVIQEKCTTLRSTIDKYIHEKIGAISQEAVAKEKKIEANKAATVDDHNELEEIIKQINEYSIHVSEFKNPLYTTEIDKSVSIIKRLESKASQKISHYISLRNSQFQTLDNESTQLKDNLAHINELLRELSSEELNEFYATYKRFVMLQEKYKEWSSDRALGDRLKRNSSEFESLKETVQKREAELYICIEEEYKRFTKILGARPRILTQQYINEISEAADNFQPALDFVQKWITKQIIHHWVK
ncbi:unnamed protein product, partial [marine sediment metagenome]